MSTRSGPCSKSGRHSTFGGEIFHPLVGRPDSRPRVVSLELPSTVMAGDVWSDVGPVLGRCVDARVRRFPVEQFRESKLGHHPKPI